MLLQVVDRFWSREIGVCQGQKARREAWHEDETVVLEDPNHSF